jgi:hypothetical protein
MGIKGLWKVSSNHVKQKGSHWTDLTQIISPACEIWPLCEFTVMEGFRRGLEQGSEPALMKIGVDGRSIMVLTPYSIYWTFEPLLILHASTWMYEACAVFQHNHAGAGPSPELRTLFYRLTGLHKAACHIHFIFDSRDCLATKRGKKVKVAPRFLTRGFQELITAFGFTWHTVILVCSVRHSVYYLPVFAGTWRSRGRVSDNEPTDTN